jgi:DNA modification methylase
MLDFGFYNRDCMEGMKEFPDKYFDLAIVDPPYGAGFTETGGCKGWFTKYHESPEKVGGVQRITGSEEGSTGTKTGKSFRGIQPRKKNTLKNFFVSHGIKLYGAGTTLNYPRHGVS